MSQPMEVQGLPILKDNYIWLIVNNKEKKFIAIDPGEASAVFDFVSAYGMTLDAVLITHHHADHTAGIHALKRHFNVPIVGPRRESIVGVTKAVSEGDTLSFSWIDEPIQVLDTPGHTLGHVSYLVKHKLFCGDTLFSGGCGRLFEGTPDQLYHSLQKLAALPDETSVYCAHEYTVQNLTFAQCVEPSNKIIQNQMKEALKIRSRYQPTLPSTIHLEKQINPFLRCDQDEIIHQVVTHCGQTLRNPIDVFKFMRVWKDHYTG